MPFEETRRSASGDPEIEPTVPDREMPTPRQIEPGDVIADKYIVDRTIGMGGMAQVVVARHRQLGKLVAIKLVHPSTLDDDETIQRFKREALTTASLLGEHIVRVHDVGETDEGVPYMIMDYLEGQDLRSILLERGVLPIADVFGYGMQACEAFAEAHDAGIIHRDIKPANLFLANVPGKKPSIRVLDFGVAKGRVGTSFASKITMVGSAVGTPRFMAPEQLDEASEIDGRTDVWGLGATLYQLATGKPPFDGKGFTMLARGILREEPIAPEALRPEIGRALSHVILRCLRKRPSERFANMRDLSAALQQAMETSGLRVIPAGLPQWVTAPIAEVPPATVADVAPETIDILSGPPMAIGRVPAPAGQAGTLPLTAAVSPAIPVTTLAMLASPRHDARRSEPPGSGVAVGLATMHSAAAYAPMPRATATQAAKSGRSWQVAILAGALVGALVLFLGAVKVVRDRHDRALKAGHAPSALPIATPAPAESGTREMTAPPGVAPAGPALVVTPPSGTATVGLAPSGTPAAGGLRRDPSTPTTRPKPKAAPSASARDMYDQL